ncbi:MAG: hypothetical protein JNL42_21870 [Anaerolineae bacterium]|nr:hypothetical protein [Anaerolineae bacterium]
MAELFIRDERIAQKLRDLSEKEARSVEALLDDMIQTYESRPEDNPILRMASAAEALGLEADADDVSERFDELLRQSYARRSGKS